MSLLRLCSAVQDKDKKKSLSAELASARSTVEAALQDSINLFDAVEALFDLVKCADSCMEGKKETHKGVRTLHGGHYVCSPSVHPLMSIAC